MFEKSRYPEDQLKKTQQKDWESKEKETTMYMIDVNS